MQATVQLDNSIWASTFDRRTVSRSSLVLPILVIVDGVRRSALLRNLSSAGAMIATSAPLSLLTTIEFQCGSVRTAATVLWQRGSDFGIEFSQPISERELRQLIGRSIAVADWRKGRVRSELLVRPRNCSFNTET